MKVVKVAVNGLIAACMLSGVAFAQDVAKGEKVYADNKCSTCHAIKGVGNAKMGSALDGVGGKLTAADIKKWLTDPASMEAKLVKKPTMPMSAFLKSHKLADADVDALVAYMTSLK